MIKQILKKILKNNYLFSTLITLILLQFHKIKHQKIKSFGIPYLKGSGISIGNNCIINNSLKSNPVGYSHRSIIIAYKNAVLHIGDNVGMSHVTIIATKEIQIDDGVMLGGGVNIYDSDFHSLNYTFRGTIDDFKYALSSSVHICKNAFIGTQTTILKGVTIGENSIVGACSLVTKDIPANEIWGGVPAKFIKKLELL